MTALRKYIKNSWDKAVSQKTEGDLKLPFPFVPPCIEGNFRVLFYWDTYFTNIGLIADGRTELAKNNVDDLIAALDYFGCVPNYTRDDGADYCSQPPLLALMVKDVYAATGDRKWLDYAARKLEKEYAFWMKKRMTQIGLNQYGTNQKDVDKLCAYFDNEVRPRIGFGGDMSRERKAARAIDFLAEGESGEDFTPRYDDHNATECVQIDLNSHLWFLESFLAECFAKKDSKKSEFYDKKRQERLNLLQKYCFDKETGLYYDYNFKTKTRSKRICAACFLPFFYGFAKDKSGLDILYEKLVTKSGVVACEDTGEYVYQWGYPNIWAPHQFFAYNAFANFGLNDYANGLADGYMGLLEKEFTKSGKIWERYDTGGVAKALEYDTQPMLGWTAGVYNCFYDKRTKQA